MSNVVKKWNTELIDAWGVPSYIKKSIEVGLTSKNFSSSEYFLVSYPLNLTAEKKGVFVTELLSHIGANLENSWFVHPEDSEVNEKAPLFFKEESGRKMSISPISTLDSLEYLASITVRSAINGFTAFISEDIILEFEELWFRIILKSKEPQSLLKEYLGPFDPDYSVYEDFTRVTFKKDVIDAALIQEWNLELMLKKHIPLYIKRISEGNRSDGQFLDVKFKDNSYWVWYPKDSDNKLRGKIGRKIVQAIMPDLENAWLVYHDHVSLKKKHKGPILIKNWDVELGEIVGPPRYNYALPVKDFDFLERFAGQYDDLSLSGIIYISEEVILNFGEEYVNLILLSDEAQHSLKTYLENFSPEYEDVDGSIVISLNSFN